MRARDEDAVRRQLERLNAWGTTTVYPILLHLLDRRSRNEATNVEVVEAMHSLESFFVGLVGGQQKGSLSWL